MFKKLLKKIINYDIADYIARMYKKIPSVYKHAFWITFIALNIVYAYHTINFFWGNHEWPLMRGVVPVNRFWYEGRFTETVLYTLMGSRLLPVLLNLFSFFGISLSVVLLAVYWGVPKKRFYLTGFCLVVALMPYNLIWLYHIAQASFFWGGAFVVGGLLCYENKWGTRFFPLWCLLTVGLLFFALGMNASFLNTICICIAGRYFMAFVGGEKIKVLLKKLIGLGVGLIGAIILLKGCLIWAAHAHVLANGFYNVQHIALSDIPTKLWAMRSYYFRQFTITYPFVDAGYLTWCWGVALIGLCVALIQSVRARGILLGLAGFISFGIALLFFSQLAPLIATMDVHFWLRVTGYFSHYFLFALMLAFMCRVGGQGAMKNLLFIAFVGIGLMSVWRDMYAMRVWKQGRDAEDKLMDRVMGRLEDTDGFSYDKQYGILVLGDPSLRPRYYDGTYKEGDVSLLSWSYRAPWETMNVFNFYAPKDFITRSYRHYWNFDFVEPLFKDVSLDTLRFIESTAGVWPDKNSVFIRDSIIFIILDKNDLREFKRRIRQHLQNVGG